jgi:hypothetical protein
MSRLARIEQKLLTTKEKTITVKTKTLRILIQSLLRSNKELMALELKELFRGRNK